MRKHVQVLDLAVGQEQLVLEIEFPVFVRHPLDHAPHELAIVGMSAPKHEPTLGSKQDRARRFGYVSRDQTMRLSAMRHPKLPVTLNRCASARCARLRRNASSARLRSVTSVCIAKISTSFPLAENVGWPIVSRCFDRSIGHYDSVPIENLLFFSFNRTPNLCVQPVASPGWIRWNTTSRLGRPCAGSNPQMWKVSTDA